MRTNLSASAELQFGIVDHPFGSGRCDSTSVTQGLIPSDKVLVLNTILHYCCELDSKRNKADNYNAGNGNYSLIVFVKFPSCNKKNISKEVKHV